MSHRMQTILIVGAVLGAAILWGLATGVYDDLFDDISTIWDYLF